MTDILLTCNTLYIYNDMKKKCQLLKYYILLRDYRKQINDIGRMLLRSSPLEQEYQYE